MDALTVVWGAFGLLAVAVGGAYLQICSRFRDAELKIAKVDKNTAVELAKVNTTLAAINANLEMLKQEIRK